ncbi:MAG TPA: tRNA threonylcarbamoyladenosine dehydratase [Clostridiales bacterium]|nr:tRNA threonylcarbamoyladenosine dehydratase [Clostridiales bacterium]
MQPKEWQSRTTALVGLDAMERLAQSRVLVFGAGGVGGYIVEALARGGVGAIGVVDGDVFAPSNLNRQIIATQGTLGQPKAEIAARRIKEINPDCEAVAYNLFVTAENAGEVLDLFRPDYVADAIDTVTCKLAIITAAKERGIPVITCMGTGNKLDPSRFRITDISKTSICPLAKVMRKKLRERGITGVMALWSDEEPLKPQGLEHENKNGRHVPGSISYVPPVAGLMIAGYILRQLGGF